MDPSQRPEAREEWQHLARRWPIASLKQTHDSVATTFAHGGHKGQLVTDTSHRLVTAGTTTPKDWPLMVAAKSHDGLWVVYGNRRLKAMQAASELGWCIKGVNCIVHDLRNACSLGDQLLPFFAKYLDAPNIQILHKAKVCTDGPTGPGQQKYRRRQNCKYM